MIPSQFDLSHWSGITAALVPELFLAAWALMLTLVAAWRRKENGQYAVGVLALVGLTATLLIVLGV